MFESISFCIGNKTIEVNGQTLSLGELSVECFNITIDEYRTMKQLLTNAQQKMEAYERSHDLGDWFSANEYFIQLDDMFCRHRLFQLIRQENLILSEAREFTQQYSLYEINDNYSDEQIMNRFPFGEDYDIESIYTNKPRELLILPGDIKIKWEYYQHFCEMYALVLSDIASINDTIQRFINHWLADLDQLNPSRYAEALHSFLYDERSYKWISTPVNGFGFYMAGDPLTLWHVPRETSPSSGQYKIYTYYEVKMLQALLKIDFYQALEAGYTVRRCAYCKRYFLLRDARHTKYCDRPAPNDPKHTCAQLGYRFKGLKETVGDSQRANSLRRCGQRIDRDCSRGIITREEKERLYKKAKDLFHQAETKPGISYEDFEQSLASKNLYPLCGVVRRSAPKGRPKQGEIHDK